MDSNQINNLFLRSALTEENPIIATSEVIPWMREREGSVDVEVERIPFSKLTQWHFDKEKGNLRHISGKFSPSKESRSQQIWGKC